MSSRLGEYHHAEDAPAKGSRYISWAVIVIIVGAAAFYVVESGMLHPVPVQAGQAYPRGL